jgi:hypothetical protein
VARTDLLALTHEDLEMLSNRGTVKRSQRELDENEVQFELEEDPGGNISLKWSDGFTTVLLADKMLKDCKCSCAVKGACRHIIRAVLAYQLKVHPQSKSGENNAGLQRPQSKESVAPDLTAAPEPDSSKQGDPSDTTHGGVVAEAKSEYVTNPQPLVQPDPPTSGFALEPWNPGDINDSDLETMVGSANITKAQRLFSEGQIVELAVGLKPFARFHTLSHSIRFLVPFDLRYTRCDCAEPQPCFHIPLAVLAFRALPENRIASTFSTAPRPAGVQNLALFNEITDALQKLIAVGISQINPALLGGFKRMIERCENEELIWSTEILSEIVMEIERHREHDARYSGAHAVSLIAESFIRIDAMKADTGVIPFEWIKGLKSDRATEFTSTRLVGLGCGGTISRFGSSLVAYMQDIYSGTLITMQKDFVEKRGEERRTLWTLADKPILRNPPIGLGQVGKGQILTKGGKLTAARVYEQGRANLSFNYQSYQWEQLRPPLSVESFAELRAVVGSRFPSYVGPRYAGGNFYVCAVQGATRVRFNDMDQSIEAILIDRYSEQAQMIFPYFSACAQGSDLLLQTLKREPDNVRFVSGHVRAGRHGLQLRPVAVVFDDGTKRTMIQPWVDRLSAADQKSVWQPAQLTPPRDSDPLHEFIDRMIEELGSLLTIGLERVDSRTALLWSNLAKESESLGFSFIASAISRLAVSLSEKASSLDWKSDEATRHCVTTAVLLVIAQAEAVRSN